MTSSNRFPAISRTRQQGITTLAVTLILLVIVTVMVLFSTSIGFFEQKTTTNEDRSRISQQAAEYALNLAGEYLKANRNQILSDVTSESGWMAPSTSAHWAKCADVASMGTTHPCMSEPDATRRAQLYFWTADGTTGASNDLPYLNVIPSALGARVENGVGGASNFAATTTVHALLCRLDTSDPSNVQCKLDPVAGNRVALTLIADASLSNENGSKASIKETWATYSPFVPSASVPLIASGFVQGLGNGQIVANPDSQSNGSNVIASVWSPNNVSVDGSGGGVGSFITCQYAEFTGQLAGGLEMSMHDVKTTCPSASGTSPPCNCPKAPDPNRTMKEDWSGHGTGGGSTLHKGNDILDVANGGESTCDSTVNTITDGCRTLPSITFFPGPNGSGTPMDKAGVLDDDSMFEYIFGVDYVASDRGDSSTLTNCGSSGTQNCVDYAMREQFSATVVADCSSLGPSSTGIIWVTGPCSQINTQIGTPDNPVIVVINQGGNSISLKNGTIMYGMLFLHSDHPLTAPVQVGGTNSQVYGSLVVEGDIKMTGGFTIVYDSTSASSNKNKIPSNAKFALVPGSWLDAKTAN